MVTTQKRAARTRKRSKSAEAASLSEVFTSSMVKGTVLLLIVSFNVVVLKNSFLMAVPSGNYGSLSGDMELDGLLYGTAISILMVIVLFHEEKWQNAFCPGAITLYLDALILVLYTKWFDWLIGAWWTQWIMGGLMIVMPVMGLFIMVIMLKK